MSREILVITPENIEIEYELAGIGTRFLANMIDSLFQVLYLVGIGVVSLIVYGLLSWMALAIPNASVAGIVKHLVSFLADIAIALAGIVVFVVMWGYYIYYEIVWNGQTPGKRNLGLRVLRDGGYPINPFAAITRNLLRVIDGIPAIVLALVIAGAASNKASIASAGSVSIVLTLCFLLFSGRYQRLGDFIAGTMVVKQRAPRIANWQGTGAVRTRKSWFKKSDPQAAGWRDTDGPPPGAWLDALAPAPRVLPDHLAPYALKDIGRHVYEMTVPEYRAVRHAIDRRWQLPAPMQQVAAMRLAVPLMQRLGITPPPGVQRINYADLLEYLAVAFEQYRGVK